LSGTARTDIELHLADCDTCRELIADTVMLSRQPLRPTLFGFSRQRVMAGGGAALALAASLVVVARVQPDLLGLNPAPDYARLIAALAENRTVEGRLTGGFAYAPMKPSTRSARADVNEDFALLAATSELQERAQQDPSAANRHAAGVGQLVTGDHEGAIAALESVVSEEPGHAQYQSDLAAAYLVRGRAEDRRDDFAKAKAAADRAIMLDPSLDEAYFNRALALDALGQTGEAEAAYRRALTRDPQSPWNAEITTRLQQVRRP
jgi:tetratricopeptide (TPR) repeat protein